MRRKLYQTASPLLTLQILTGLVALLVVAATVLPIVRTTAGIVRICDFPRPQVLVLGLIVLTAVPFLFDWRSLIGGGIALATLAAVAVQAMRIAPYTPLFPKQGVSVGNPGPGACLSLLIANVRQDNRDAAELIRLLVACDADLVFLVEVDDRWLDQLGEVRRRYAHETAMPQDDGYGLLFLSRLPVVSCEVRRLAKPNIPSIRAALRMESGGTFSFYGLHPEPPGPATDADDRNTELLIVAREVAAEDRPSIVAGDLNDVAWSRTNRMFQRVSGTIDPRAGRGMYATYHTKTWFARWPIDHLFYSRHFALGELKVLPDVGSDHFPVFGRLCLVGVDERPVPDAAAEKEAASL